MIRRKTHYWRLAATGTFRRIPVRWPRSRPVPPGGASVRATVCGAPPKRSRVTLSVTLSPGVLHLTVEFFGQSRDLMDRVAGWRRGPAGQVSGRATWLLGFPDGVTASDAPNPAGPSLPVDPWSQSLGGWPTRVTEKWIVRDARTLPACATVQWERGGVEGSDSFVPSGGVVN